MSPTHSPSPVEAKVKFKDNNKDYELPTDTHQQKMSPTTPLHLEELTPLPAIPPTLPHVTPLTHPPAIPLPLHKVIRLALDL